MLLKELRQRARAELGIHLSLDEKAKDFLAEKGYDPKYGARPLRRTIQSYLENPLSEEILNGRVTRDSTVRITVDKSGEKLKFTARRSK